MTFPPAHLDNRSLCIAAYPPRVTELANPYFTLCHAALAKRGISVSDSLEIDLYGLRARAGTIDAVHLHWPELIWRREPFGHLSRPERALRASYRILYLWRFVREARRLGLQRIWTLHNLEPHEGAYRWDRWGYRLLARECDLIVCHSHSAVELVRRHYSPRGRVIVMPIGELASAYPAPRARSEVLAGLGLDPRLPVVSCLGRLRHYKGLGLACEALARLHGRVQLIIAGPRHAGFELETISESVAATPGAILIDRKLPDQEFADLMAASDAVLLPYRSITGSAALLTALGFGRGVIAADLGYFREILATEPQAGTIVPSQDPATWASRIAEYLSRPEDERRNAALRLAAQYSWDRCVEPLAAAVGARERASAVRATAVGAAT